MRYLLKHWQKIHESVKLIFTSFRSPNDIPPLTKTQYYYKTHQRATVSIPKHHRHSRIPISPDEKETQSYVTKVDTTHLGPRKKRFRDDDDDESSHHLKPFFRTGKGRRLKLKI